MSVNTYANFAKGGSHGAPFKASRPNESIVLDYLTGKKTLMPKGGPPLEPGEIDLFRRWIAAGAKDDTPVVKDPIDQAHPPIYYSAPVLTALAYSPDGQTLAISGYREVLLEKADGSGIVARLVGNSEKILSIAYSPNGKLLMAAGGSPARFGEIQFWDTSTNKEMNSVQTTFDTVFGASFSPDGTKVGFGCADHTVRVITVPDGKEVMRLDNHSDWVFATAFSMDSKDVVSASRDQAVKLTLVNDGSFIDDINTHYTNLRCLVRNPKVDQIVCGGDDGIPRLYKVFRTEVRTMNQEDHNLIRTFDKQPGAVTALAFNPAGTLIAAGSEGNVVNVYNVADGKNVAALRGHKGVIYTLAFSPDGKTLAAGGFDGTVRLYNIPSGTLAKAFVPVTLSRPAPRHIASSSARL